MTGIVGYRDLKVWQKAMELVLDIYRATEKFPVYELYGLSSQMRRAAVSIPSNISEGHARDSTGYFVSHLSFARGSVAELETQLELSIRLGYIERDAATQLLNACDEIGKMLRGLKNSVVRRSGA